MNGYDEAGNPSRRPARPRHPRAPRRASPLPTSPIENMPPGPIPPMEGYPNVPMNTLERLRAQSMALTGGRTPNMFPQDIGLQGRAADFHREAEIRYKTNQKRPIDIVPDKCPARDAAGPPINVNLTQLTSDAQGKLDTSMWMHDWFGHSCGCGEET